VAQMVAQIVAQMVDNDQSAISNYDMSHAKRSHDMSHNLKKGLAMGFVFH
jgi:hypothetical protein